MIKIIKYFLNLPLDICRKIILFSLYDKKIYYGNYKNSTDSIRVFFKNILNPNRIIIRYTKKSKNFNEKAIKINKGNEIFLSSLKNDGVVKIENFVSDYDCEKLNEQSFTESIEKKFVSEFDSSITIYKYAIITKEIESVILNPILLNIASAYFKKKIFAATYPHFHSIYSKSNSAPSKDIPAWSQINSSWHYDVPLTLACFVLLHDVDKTGSYTKYAATTHKLYNINIDSTDRYLSDEYIEQKKIKVLDLYGKKGDLIIFDVNGFHKLHNAKDAFRKALKFEISCGIQVEMNYAKIHNSMKSGFDPGKLEKENKEYLSGLFPMGRPYDFDGDTYYKGVSIY